MSKQQQILDLFKANNISLVHFTWCDTSNQIRSKAVHINQLEHYLEDGVGITQAYCALPVMYDAVSKNAGVSAVGEVRVLPDWDAAGVIPFAPGHARIIGQLWRDGAPCPYSGRNFLKRMIAAAAQQNLKVKAGFETEYILVHRDPITSKITPVDRTNWCSTFAVYKSLKVVDDIVDALIHQDVPVEQSHSEAAPGQHELSVKYSDALTAADRQTIVRETIHAVADKHGQVATLLPKVFAEAAGNGQHIHMSIWDAATNTNLFPDKNGDLGVSKLGRHFIGGILKHLPAIAAVTIPTTNSYRRIAPGYWSGAYITWSLDNRESAVRVPSNPRGTGSTNFEIKTVDASSNPYIALGVLIAAGLDGIKNSIEPPAALAEDPSKLTDQEREALGLKNLPTSAADALNHLKQDQVILDAMGPALAQAYIAVHEAELEFFNGKTIDEEVQALLQSY